MKKILKKSLACMLAAILCLTACVGAMASVGAEGAITYAIADVAIDQGAEGVIDVTVSNFADVAGLIAEITLPDAVVSIDGVKLNDSAELVEMTDETAGHYVVNGKTVKFVGLFNSLNEFGDALANVDTLEINIAVTVADEASVTAFAAPVFMAGNFNEEILDVTGTVGTLTVNAVCKHTETKTVEENRVEADCVNDGSYDEVVYCAACDFEISRTKKTIAALGHTEGEVVIENQVAADCDTDGSYDEVVYCTVCGEELSRETKTVDALGHEEAEAVIENNVAPDCVNAGSYDTVVYCTVCNEEISRVTTTVEALGHTEVIDAAVAPTCTETGLTEGSHCSVCGEVLVAQEVVPVIDHNYVDGKCDVCGADDPNYKPECEHVDANQDGICDNCDYENLDETLVFFGKAMSLGDDIRGVFQVRNYKKNTFANTYVSFKVIVEKEGVKSELELVAESVKTNYTTYGYAITVAPKEMVDILNARIVGITAEGEAFISNVDTWSIKEGLISNMASASTGELTEVKLNTLKLAANMLNYGAEAQKNFNYKVDNLATDNLPEEYAQYIITETPEMSEIPAADETGVTSTLKGISFNLEAKVEMIVMFKVPKTDAKEIYSAQITQVHTAPDGTVTTNNYTIEGKDCLMSGTTLGVYINNLRSNDLRDVLTITLYKDGVAVSATHTLSAESVAKSKMDANPTLVSALMVYGDCARALFK